MKGVVSGVTWEKVLKAFSLEPRVLPTGEPVDTTRQAKLSKLVKAAFRYDIPLLRSQELQTHGQTDTHTQNTAINTKDPETGSTWKFICNFRKKRRGEKLLQNFISSRNGLVE